MIGVTRHAVERWQERVRPALDLDQCRAELLALVRAAGQPSSEQPAWHTRAVPNSLYLNISDGIACTVQDGSVTTVLTRGEEAAGHRQAKKARQKKRRAERAARRNAISRTNSRESFERRTASWD